MEDEYADIYYVDSRNAVRDWRADHHRPWHQPRPRPVVRPTRTVYVPQAPQPAIPSPMPAYAQPQVIYTGPFAGQSTAATLLGKLTTGQIVEMVAQVFAALQSLPGAPVATKDVATDVANLVIYQSALAGHAKRDEQVRTLGSLVARLVG